MSVFDTRWLLAGLAGGCDRHLSDGVIQPTLCAVKVTDRAAVVVLRIGAGADGLDQLDEAADAASTLTRTMFDGIWFAFFGAKLASWGRKSPDRIAPISWSATLCKKSD